MWTLRAVGAKAELYFFFKLINEFLSSGSSYLFLALMFFPIEPVSELNSRPPI